jgi:hypothetical protein
MEKFTTITLFVLLMSFGLTSCHLQAKQEVPNNWTVDDKAKVGGSANIMIMMSNNATLIANKSVICDCVVNESIKKYPRIEDFKSNLDYSSEAFRFCLNKADS